MTDEVSQQVAYLQQAQDDQTLARDVVRYFLLDNSPYATEVVRGVARQRPELHWRWRAALPDRGNVDVRNIDLLLVILPEMWLRDLEGVLAILQDLLNAEGRPQATVAATHKWVANARQGGLDHLYPGLAVWLQQQGL